MEDSPAVWTIVYAVNMNHTREHHFDGTVLISGTDGTVFESLARSDLFITDAVRENVIGSRHRDRDTAFIDTRILLDLLILLSNIIYTDTTTLSSRTSLILLWFSNGSYCWTSAAPLRFPIFLLSRTGRKMLTFI
jgi:cleavage and polyadenylation specificity factor subunit 2